jgi:hypothetical protein
MVRFALAGIVALALAGPVLAKTAPTMPAQLRGIWMTDNAAGRTQCRDYLDPLRAKQGQAAQVLVGSLVITSQWLHGYAEYGEGNFYAPRRVTTLGQQRWRIDSALGIDGPPKASTRNSAVFTLSLVKGTLNVRLDSVNGEPGPTNAQERYFRCAAVPSGMYAG